MQSAADKTKVCSSNKNFWPSKKKNSIAMDDVIQFIYDKYGLYAFDSMEGVLKRALNATLWGMNSAEANS
jgi:hypothetical protein